MDRCPACRARYKGDPDCYRCGTKLSLPLEAERQADARAKQALQHVLEDNFEAARIAIDQAVQLKAEPAFLALQAFISDYQRPSPVQILKEAAEQVFFAPRPDRFKAGESRPARMLKISRKWLNHAASKILENR